MGCIYICISTPSPLTGLPSGEECSAGEMGEWGRGAASRLYLVRPVRRSNPSDY